MALIELFGRRFEAQYGDEPAGLWLDGLNSLDPHEIKRGIGLLVTQRWEWPPTLPEFMALCRPRKRENEAMYRRYDLPALPPPRDREKAHQALRAMRARLKV